VAVDRRPEGAKQQDGGAQRQGDGGQGDRRRTQIRRLLVDYNATQAEYPKDKCIHQLFVEQAARDGEKTAVFCGEERLTYRELHARSQDLALYLQSQGVGPDRLVGLCMDRSLEMVVGLFGILQAGGAYVPLDPGYPDERLAYMLRDSRAAVVLTQEKLEDKLGGLIPAEARLVCLDRQWMEIGDRVAGLRAANVRLQEEVRPRHLAYVIYTSGSTGQPKGAAIEHHSPVTLAHWAGEVYSPEEWAGVLASTFCPISVRIAAASRRIAASARRVSLSAARAGAAMEINNRPARQARRAGTPLLLKDTSPIRLH